MAYKLSILIGEFGIIRGSEYAELKAFVTIVEQGSFTAAAAQLGISASTLSQTIRELETRLGVRLLNRTTRSVSMTHAGERLHTRFNPAMAEMEAAVRDVADLRDLPAGPLRVHMSRASAAALLEPHLGRFHETYPDILLNVTIDEAVTDLVEAGYDAGIRLGEFLEPDMVAVKLGGEQRQIAVASPDYVERHGKPEIPADLLHHSCINWRQPGSSTCYKWEFFKNGQWSHVAVAGPLVVSQRDMAVAAALQGVGIAFWSEERLRPLIDEGKLVPLLGDWCGFFPGWFLYYPKQRRVPSAVRAFAEFLREANRA